MNLLTEKVLLILTLTTTLASAQSFMERGVTAFEQEQYKEAERWFYWAIAADSADAQRYLNRAHTRLKRGNIKGACSDLKDAITLSPTNGDAHFWLGFAAFRLGDYQVAADHNLLAYQHSTSHSSQALLNQAQAQIRLNQNEKALTNFGTVISLDDANLMNAHFGRGQLYMQMNNPMLALADFKKVVELDPSNVQLTWDIGRISYDLESYSEALTYYSKAMEKLEAPEAQLYVIRAETFEKLKYYEAAINDYSTAIDLNGNLASAYYGRGQAKARSGNTEAACIDWKRASELGHEEAKDVIVYNCK